MRKHWPAVVLISLAMTIPSMASAQDATQAGAAQAASAEAAVGTSIENRTLGGAAESFPATTQVLWCFSRVSNAADSQVEHVWYKGDIEMGRVPLKVGGSPWRVYSSKKLGENPSGEWRCDVVQAGKVLESVKFKVE
jgi:hypothetical protein